MDFKDFKNKEKSLKRIKLGGLEAQFKLAPKLRLRFDELKIEINNPKKAAVLALFYPNKNNETCFLLTERATYKGTHSAQISFPGGKIEKTDLNKEATALRESFEEIGVDPKSIKVLRELTDVYIPPSNFLVTPFIAFCDVKPSFIINHEVENIIEVLVKDLLNDDNLTVVQMNTSYMKNTEVPSFKLNDYYVWGATAMMLSEIKELLKE